METNGNQKKIETLTYIVKGLMQDLPYHNFSHALDVYSATNTLASLGGISDDEKFLLDTAALLHDVIVVPGAGDNEEKSAELARKYLPSLGYSEAQAGRVYSIILATKMPQRPKDLLEQTICDADLDNLGRDDFFELGEKVREELKAPKSTEWCRNQLKFLKSHEYHTEAARKLRNPGKQQNIQKLEEMLQEGKC
ncbi:MAG: phosphohydrolase [Nanoarchaeota archaeon]|nr:phosphohydrolase [Nanoarchaeota archaeon]